MKILEKHIKIIKFLFNHMIPVKPIILFMEKKLIKIQVRSQVSLSANFYKFKTRKWNFRILTEEVEVDPII